MLACTRRSWRIRRAWRSGRWWRRPSGRRRPCPLRNGPIGRVDGQPHVQRMWPAQSGLPGAVKGGNGQVDRIEPRRQARAARETRPSTARRPLPLPRPARATRTAASSPPPGRRPPVRSAITRGSSSSQSTTDSRGTLLKCRMLPVTIVSCLVSAIAAMRKSASPISVPKLSNSALISP